MRGPGASQQCSWDGPWEPGWDHHKTTMRRRMPTPRCSQHLPALAAGDRPCVSLPLGCQVQQSFLIFRGQKNDKVSLWGHKSEWLQLYISNNPLHFKAQTLTAAWEDFLPRQRVDRSHGTNPRVKRTNPAQLDGCLPYRPCTATNGLPTGSNGWVANQGTGTHLPAPSQALLWVFIAPSPHLLDGNHNTSSPRCAAVMIAW